MATSESLTEREQQALEHMRKAQELGVTLKEYAASFGLDVQKLYQLRNKLTWLVWMRDKEGGDEVHGDQEEREGKKPRQQELGFLLKSSLL